MKIRKALYGMAVLVMSFTLLNSMNLAVQAQLLPLPPAVPTFLAQNDFATTNEDIPTTINVLANDVGSETGLFSVRSVTQPSNGVAIISSSNAVRYTPNANFFGSDSFRYTASDATGLTQSSATVFITINPVNDPPVANDDFITTDEDTSVAFFAEENDFDVDGDEIFVISMTQQTNGRTALFTNGAIIYTPNRDFNGQDPFTYTISDGNGGTDTGNVFVTVNPVPDFVINKRSSGLVASDPLTQPKTMEQMQSDRYWFTDGSARVQNAPFEIFQDASGLHIGVQALREGAWAGYYAVTPPTDALLFHAVITTEARTIPANFANNGMYVQTADPNLIRYVACLAVTSNAGTSWHIFVAQSSGTLVQDTVFEILWSDPTPIANQPLTRDCTIITNGSNYLKVYLDNRVVYENDQLNLGIPSPYHVFLEPQNSHPIMFFGSYRDFYITSDENIRVINAPSNAARVELVDTANNILASASVSGGTAILDVGRFNFPLAANIRVLDSNGAEIVSTNAPQSIFGGDVFSVDQT